MRSTFSALIGLSLLLASGCAEPPKPEKTDASAEAARQGQRDPQEPLPPLPDGPIAKVGDVDIPSEKFHEIYDLKVAKYTEKGREITPAADRRYRKSITDRLIYQEVLAQEARKLGVEYDAEAYAARDAQQRRGIRDWADHLQRRGETEQSLRESMEAELREQAILEHLGRLEVSEADIAADYEKVKEHWKSDKPRVRASHILVLFQPDAAERTHPGAKPPEVPEDEQKRREEVALARAKEIHAMVTAPDADFAAIAAEQSTGPSKAKGGDIGIFPPDRMAEEFSQAAFALEPGEISEPVKTQFGYHIIKVTGKWPPGVLPLEALQDEIHDRLRQRKLHQGKRELKKELLARYEIVDNIAPTLGPEPRRGVRNRGPNQGPRRANKPRGVPAAGRGRGPNNQGGNNRRQREQAEGGAPGRPSSVPPGPGNGAAAGEAGKPITPPPGLAAEP